MAEVKTYEEINIEYFPQLFKVAHLFSDHYVFRGQADKGWPLDTSFERAVSSVDDSGLLELEQKIMLEFKRRAHHYISDVPPEDNHLEWLALMQHHGCPTRLLDFTRSFYVALFFAIEAAQSDSAIWAINSLAYKLLGHSMMKDYLYSKYDGKAEGQANEILSNPNKDELKTGVLFVEPYRLNERLSIQQGCFVFPKNLKVSFEENLCEPLGAKKFSELNKQMGINWSILKITIPQHMHLTISYWLSTMNITAATLFPGLDGFARSQITHIRIASCHEQIMGEALKEAFGVDYEKMIRLAMDGINESEGRSPQKEQ